MAADTINCRTAGPTSNAAVMTIIAGAECLSCRKRGPGPASCLLHPGLFHPCLFHPAGIAVSLCAKPAA